MVYVKLFAFHIENTVGFTKIFCFDVNNITRFIANGRQQKHEAKQKQDIKTSFNPFGVGIFAAHPMQA